MGWNSQCYIGKNNTWCPFYLAKLLAFLWVWCSFCGCWEHLPVLRVSTALVKKPHQWVRLTSILKFCNSAAICCMDLSEFQYPSNSALYLRITHALIGYQRLSWQSLSLFFCWQAQESAVFINEVTDHQPMSLPIRLDGQFPGSVHCHHGNDLHRWEHII